MPDSLISIILPVYNQADHIGAIVEGYLEALSRLPCAYELLLVTNGCRDNSPAICRELAAQYPQVRTCDSVPGGWGLAVKLGLQEAQGDLLCYTNSARTTPQDLVLMLLYALVYPNTVFKATRKIRDNWKRRLGSGLYNLECRLLFRLSQKDINGTPKVFPRTFGRLLALKRDDDLIDAEFNAVCHQAGYPLLEVPIFSHRRHGGQSTTKLSSAFKMYRGAYHLWRAQKQGNK